MSCSTASTAILVFLLVASSGARGHVIEEMARLAPGDDFVTSVDIDGDRIVIGAPPTGAAYVFRRDGVEWVEDGKPLFFPGESFGHSVAIDGNWIVIGAPDLSFEPISTGIGRAFVFARNDRDTPDDQSDDFWERVAILNPPPSHLCCSFGISVDVAADVIVVGSSPPVTPGRAYVFRWDGTEWQPDATLLASDATPGDWFGGGVAVTGDLILVGAARGRNVTGESVGSAYVFQLDATTWVEQAKLVASDGAPGDFFGAAVSAGKQRVVVGARNDDDGGPSSGSLYVFHHDASKWVQEQKLVQSDPRALSNFGLSVATDGESIVAGAVGESWGYVFRHGREGWVQSLELVGNQESHIHPVAVDGPYALIANYVYAIGESVTLLDFAQFQGCFGSGDTTAPACERFDLERDGTIDFVDLAVFLLTFRGP